MTSQLFTLGTFRTWSPKVRELLEPVRRAAGTDATILIGGESGVGKEVLANAIHALSPRNKGPFVARNMGGLSEKLVEDELFGHVKGAFADAASDRKGLFVAANGGTLFLDEIGELPLLAQASLLRVIQEKRVSPLGSDGELDVDVRLVVATNRDLEPMIAAGTFRQDLYYRLKVVLVTLPPLRDRPEDLEPLAEIFLKTRTAAWDRPAGGRAPSLDVLRDYAWPGNVRELQNAIEAAVAARFDPDNPQATVLVRPEDVLAEAQRRMTSNTRTAAASNDAGEISDSTVHALPRGAGAVAADIRARLEARRRRGKNSGYLTGEKLEQLVAFLADRETEGADPSFAHADFMRALELREQTARDWLKELAAVGRDVEAAKDVPAADGPVPTESASADPPRRSLPPQVLVDDRGRYRFARCPRVRFRLRRSSNDRPAEPLEEGDVIRDGELLHVDYDAKDPAHVVILCVSIRESEVPDEVCLLDELVSAEHRSSRPIPWSPAQVEVVFLAASVAAPVPRFQPLPSIFPPREGERVRRKLGPRGSQALERIELCRPIITARLEALLGRYDAGPVEVCWTAFIGG